jgi:hypothetical protein
MGSKYSPARCGELAAPGNRTSLCVDSYKRVLQNRLHLYIAADARMVHVEHEVIALVQG